MKQPDDAPGELDLAFQTALLEDDPAQLYESSPCAYLSILQDGRLVKVNRTFLRWTGYRAEDILGTPMHGLLSAGARIYYETHVRPMLQMQGSVREIALDVVRADGDFVPMLMNAVLEAPDGARSDEGVVRIAMFDASERRAYELELLASRKRAEAAEQRARALAETLQASLLPPTLLTIPGLEVAGGYRPAGDGSEVGGDFYEVFETGRGTWGIVLGDVCGKGAEAAVLTSLARYTIRAEATHDPKPSSVLASVHDAFRQYHPRKFCTALFLLLGRVDGSIRVTMASGGHQLPILVRDGTITRLGEGGTILGILDETHLVDTDIRLRPGDTVVLYTDGVTEARRNGRFLDESGLERIILESSATTAQALADDVVEKVVDFQAGAPRDDIAVVVVHVPPADARR